MPKQVRDAEQFQKLMSKAVELRVVREKESVKLKLRTSEYLYTFKTTRDEAEVIIKNANELEVVEISPAKEKEKSSSAGKEK
ncbi:MAG: 50S ribosomal protein L38e [Nitrososphaerales archaeon]